MYKLTGLDFVADSHMNIWIPVVLCFREFYFCITIVILWRQRCLVSIFHIEVVNTYVGKFLDPIFYYLLFQVAINFANINKNVLSIRLVASHLDRRYH